MLLREIKAWIDIYNKYKTKMPLYYMHSKAFHPLFNSLLNKIANFQKVNINIYNFIEIGYNF